MIYRIKNKIDQGLVRLIQNIDKLYSLSKVSPLLLKSIKEFVLRKGKRIRPILFVIGYLGFSKKEPKNLYASALSIELLHDFFLIHDDIIDKSDTRRGKPSMHKMLDNYLASHKNIKFNGQDLSIVVGDIINAMALSSFLSIKEDPQRKEKALKKLIQATIFTGCGEFIELLLGLKSIEKLTKRDIYKIYDYKTSYYTFACPLSIGAILAGTSQNQIDKLFQYGIYLGRAFQIKDDILGLFGDEAKIGKSTLSDLQEAKKTLLIWYAYNKSTMKNRALITKILLKKKVTQLDLLQMHKIIKKSGALDYAKREISRLLKKAGSIIASSKMRTKYKNLLSTYCEGLLSL
jgi:geranylgeranyl diphosphate synthase type I